MRYAIGAYVAALVIMVVLEIVLLVAGVGLGFGDGALLFELAFLSTLVPLWRSGRLGIRDLGLRPVPGARSTGLVLLGLIAYGWFSLLWSSALHLPHAASNFTGISHHSLGAIVLAGFVASVGAPVAEEVFFRGFLYRSLRNRLSIAPACLLAATMFGLLHTQYPLAVRPILVFFGVITCLLYERTGSLLPGIALHCIVDAGGFESALTGNELIVASLFALLALVLLARPPLRGLARLLTGRPVFRDFGAEGDGTSSAAPGQGGDGQPQNRVTPPGSGGGRPESSGAPRQGGGGQPHNPFALTDDGRWQPSERARMSTLVACLALAIVALLDARTSVFSTGSTRASAFAAMQTPGLLPNGGCERAASEPLARVDLAGVVELRADITPLMDRLPGRTYGTGTVTPQDMWSDEPPQPLAQARPASGMWPASYEIRRFASDGDDVVADVLALTTAAQADRFLAAASNASCHRDGRSSRAPDPPRTRDLIWTNPDGFTQQDAFLARGDLVYRVADVRSPRGVSQVGQEREALATVNRLACSLAYAGCGRAHVYSLFALARLRSSNSR
jgi:membrane protease YdiL (CAAX protease family)